jgi:hypothetical protein
MTGVFPKKAGSGKNGSVDFWPIEGRLIVAI